MSTLDYSHYLNRDAAMPPCEDSFIAAELIWGEELSELKYLPDLIRFIGYREKQGGINYAYHWKEIYQRWCNARNDKRKRKLNSEHTWLALDEWLELEQQSRSTGPL